LGDRQKRCGFDKEENDVTEQISEALKPIHISKPSSSKVDFVKVVQTANDKSKDLDLQLELDNDDKDDEFFDSLDGNEEEVDIFFFF
jgi:hypothetical protein